MQLSYRTVGKPTDQPLIFIHGLGSGSFQATNALPSLPDTYLIAPDMPGHGDSLDFSVDELNFDSFADKVVAFMDGLGIESCNMGGISMGSGITLNIALRYPERVKKMIILRPSWLNQTEPEHLKLVAYVGQWIEEFGIETARAKLLADPDFQHLDRENKPMANSIGNLFTRPNTKVSTAVLYKMWQDSPFPSPDALSSLPNPSLVLTTTRDELHPQSTADVIAAHLPDVRSAELPPRYHEFEAYALALHTIVQKFLAE